jgi:hypothetical protein
MWLHAQLMKVLKWAALPKETPRRSYPIGHGWVPFFAKEAPITEAKSPRMRLHTH